MDLTERDLRANRGSQGRTSLTVDSPTLNLLPQKKTHFSHQRTDCPISRIVFSLTSVQIDNILLQIKGLSSKGCYLYLVNIYL